MGCKSENIMVMEENIFKHSKLTVYQDIADMYWLYILSIAKGLRGIFFIYLELGLNLFWITQYGIYLILIFVYLWSFYILLQLLILYSLMSTIQQKSYLPKTIFHKMYGLDSSGLRELLLPVLKYVLGALGPASEVLWVWFCFF